MTMTSNPVMHRLRKSAMMTLALVLLLGMPAASVAAVDQNCLKTASKNLSTELNKAYDDYSKEIQQVTKNLSDNEQQAYKNTDAQVQQNLLSRARQDYAYGQSEANRRLGSKVYQAWNTYYSRNSVCDPSSPATNTYQQNPYLYNQQSYGNQYQYPYNYYYQQSYYQQPYVQYQYPYYYQQYQYPYSNYGTYRYPYNYYNPYYYNYNQGYSYSSSVSYYNNYGVQYNSSGQYICPQVVMTTLPAGCGYDCSKDESGCRRCEVSCRRSAARTESCGCANSFRPVCGRDGVTYTNECYADCAGVEVRQLNVCAS